MSRVAAPCALSVVEGDEVEIGRLCNVCVVVDLEVVVCLEDDEGVIAGFAGYFEASGTSGSWVWIRVLTTSRGVVMTPAAPPALAAVAISNKRPILFEPI